MKAMFKVPSRPGGEVWEVPILYEDGHILAIDKPSGLAGSPDSQNPDQPNLMKMLHDGIAEGKAWARNHSLTYVMNAHRLDTEASGVFLLAKAKSVLVALANLFGAEKPCQQCLALVQGTSAQAQFVLEGRLAPHPARTGLFHVDAKRGKRARTACEVIENFSRWTLLRCEPMTVRPHQIRVHLRHADLPVVGDSVYGGKNLWLSRLKPGYRLKPNREERPLLSRPALHAAELKLAHPVTGQPLVISAPWPKDLTVAIKYLRRYAVAQNSSPLPSDPEDGGLNQ